MPLTVLLWLIVLLPAAIVLWIFFCHIMVIDGDTAVQGVVILAVLLILAAPNLLWYKAVRDVMAPSAPVTLSVEGNS